MSFSSYLRKRVIDLLNDHRIVVWYDAESDFKVFVSSFNAPGCEVLNVDTSVLKSRRRADEVYRRMNESEDSSEKDRCLLIYVPHRRGVTEDEKMRDPFEIYAMAGVAFGDTEDQKIESLARQAMPLKTEEITRLFREGKPDVELLDGLDKAQRWPLVSDVFHTENPVDVIALAICDLPKAEAVDAKPGCVTELLRLFESTIGFKPSAGPVKWKNQRPIAAQLVLFSEFLFDLPSGAPDALSAVPHSGIDTKSLVYAACDRMRADSGLRETYIELAQNIESELHLPDVMPKDFEPGARETFPFEARRLLGVANDLVIAGDFAAARSVINNGKQSIWRREPQQSPAWTALDRAVSLVETAADVRRGLCGKKDVGTLLKAYIDEWYEMDRSARLFESALTACSDEEVISPVVDLCRRRYRAAAEEMQDAFLAAVRAGGWPPDDAPRQSRIFDDHIRPLMERRERAAFFMVDSLRYEMGRDLSEALVGMGQVEISYAAGVVPTVTGCGMAALMPGADGLFRLVAKDGGLVPALGTRLLKTSADRMKYLTELYGDRVWDVTLDDLLGSPKKTAAKLKDVDLCVVRTQDPDAIAENLGGWRARRYLSDVIADIASAVRWIAAQGFSRIVISADHGHMMLPEIPAGDVVQAPPGDWLENKRRCVLGTGLAGSDGTVTLKSDRIGLHGDVQEICLPLGFRVFSGGDGYFHGGLSLQEVVVPVVALRAARKEASSPGNPEIDILYRSEKFTSRVVGLKFHLAGDMFDTTARVRIEVYDGSGAKAKVVGEAADCEARDEITREVTLLANKETPVPVLIDPDFSGDEIEIRVSDPQTRVVWAKRKLKNAMLD